jgi:hypothetical protein
LIGLFVGGVAAVQFMAINLGMYDPVADDGMSPDSVMALKGRLVGLTIGCCLTLIPALCYLVYRLVRRAA